ncbi:MAG: hypothetical protein A2Y72_00865 [Chloroflexi bacterium RBG_13_53_26]|nr:MAG: hypothetical protein A2Y72_00865 [Chloroflexi bacterium RBG_13_53_26]
MGNFSMGIFDVGGLDIRSSHWNKLRVFGHRCRRVDPKLCIYPFKAVIPKHGSKSFMGNERDRSAV